MTTINTLDDFLRALDDNPSWREAVRARILGEELLQLPARFNAFVEEQKVFNADMTVFVKNMNSFAEEQKVFNADMRAFAKDMRAFVEEQKVINAEMRAFNEEQRVWNRNATARFDRMERDISTFKDYYVSRRPFKDTLGIADDYGLEFVRLLTSEDLVRMVGNDVPRNVRHSFRNADMVIEGADETGASYIVIEVSYTADSRDTDRVIRNAEIITRFTGRPAQPVIASVRNDYSVEELIESGAVHWYPVRDHVGEP